MIKTKQQLQTFFYESRYNENNKANAVTFDHKIIVIEDIDAQGSIVLDRSRKKKDMPAAPSLTDTSSIGDVLKTLTLISASETSELTDKAGPVKRPDEDQITLDDILNLWDGIEENPGRMLVITSNHYKDLDPALTRPGRIDVSVHMSNASRKVIGDIYHHFYESSIDQDQLERIHPYLYSPAELVNLYSMHKSDKESFVETLLLNKLDEQWE
jgi:SpoVK/Ycf46/Vps4 family AAA+-type ATPase